MQTSQASAATHAAMQATTASLLQYFAGLAVRPRIAVLAYADRVTPVFILTATMSAAEMIALVVKTSRSSATGAVLGKALSSILLSLSPALILVVAHSAPSDNIASVVQEVTSSGCQLVLGYTVAPLAEFQDIVLASPTTSKTAPSTSLFQEARHLVNTSPCPIATTSSATCSPCACNVAGVAPGVPCDPGTGQCTCKANVIGFLCDACRPSYGLLQLADPFGCSGIPTGLQGPVMLAASDLLTGVASVVLTWQAPRNPNGQITSYSLFRGGRRCYSGLAFSFTDSTVVPGQSYSYFLTASTSIGSVASVTVSVTVPEATPHGLSAPALTTTGSTSILVTWDVPTQPNGAITGYTLTVLSEAGMVTRPIGVRMNFLLEMLQPYMVYQVTVAACNRAACVTSASAQVLNLS